MTGTFGQCGGTAETQFRVKAFAHSVRLDRDGGDAQLLPEGKLRCDQGAAGSSLPFFTHTDAQSSREWNCGKNW